MANGRMHDLLRDMRAILNKSEKSKRELTPSEQVRYSELETEYEALEREEEVYFRRDNVPQQLMSDPYETEKRNGGSGEARIITQPNGFSFRSNAAGEGPRYAFNRYLMRGAPALRWEELRALQHQDDPGGGYLKVPTVFIQKLIKDLDNEVFIRQLAYQVTIKGASAGAPELDNDLGDPTWTTELATGDEDSDMTLGARMLTPHPAARRIKVSYDLLRVAAMDPEELVRDRFRYKFDIVMERGYLQGTGDNEPLGIFTASAQGINTDRDVSTGNSQTAIGADNLIEVVHTLKAQYLRNATWLFHRDAIKAIRKLKDGEGQFLWQAGLGAGNPNTILGYPYHMSEYVPSTFTSGLYVGIFGNFREGYWIVDNMDMSIQRLLELYAETNQVGFIGRISSDGMPVNSNAFARVTLA